jgi:hypothetical protein
MVFMAMDTDYRQTACPQQGPGPALERGRFRARLTQLSVVHGFALLHTPAQKGPMKRPQACDEPFPTVMELVMALVAVSKIRITLLP